MEKPVNDWLARMDICRHIKIPEDVYVGDIALYGMCDGMKRVYQRDIEQLVERFGADSPEIDSIKTRAKAAGFDQ